MIYKTLFHKKLHTLKSLSATRPGEKVKKTYRSPMNYYLRRSLRSLQSAGEISDNSYNYDPLAFFSGTGTILDFISTCIGNRDRWYEQARAFEYLLKHGAFGAFEAAWKALVKDPRSPFPMSSKATGVALIFLKDFVRKTTLLKQAKKMVTLIANMYFEVRFADEAKKWGIQTLIDISQHPVAAIRNKAIKALNHIYGVTSEKPPKKGVPSERKFLFGSWKPPRSSVSTTKKEVPISKKK